MRIGKFWLLKPYEAFGNRAEDLYYGVLKCRRENLRLIVLKRKWDLIGKAAFRPANICLLDIQHPLIVNNFATSTLDYLLTFWWTICRIIGIAWRKLMSLIGFAIKQNTLVKWSEVEIGRDALWGQIEPPYSSNFQPIDWGYEHNNKLGIRFGPRSALVSDFPELIGKSYICLHVRTGGFFNDHAFSAPRNSNIENYSLAIDELVSKGYIVVRIGDPAMPPINKDGVIDYAHHTKRSQANDILLVEHCDAYIGSLTGPIDLACLFEKRIFTVNALSLSHCMWYRKGSLFIPKKVKLNGNFLTLKEQIDNHLFEVMGTGNMNPRVEYIENTEEEILTALREFLGNHQLTNNQNHFNAYLKQAIGDYFEDTHLWDNPYADTVQKMRWMARQHSVEGSVAQCWLNENWD